MIIDSSAIIAILVAEPASDRLVDTLAKAEHPKAGAPTVLESSMVLTSRMGLVGRTLLSRLLQEAGIEVVSFTVEHWPIATEAYARFGRGRHPAALNFGDCLTYAIARLADEPLLCVGEDFPRTDLEMA